MTKDRTMKTKLLTLLSLAALLSCSRGGVDSPEYPHDTSETVHHDMIVLGEQLEDPYSVENVTKALSSLYPTKAARLDIAATDLYVRFLPEDEHQYRMLEELGVSLVDHPLDYRIVREGDYYHDPEIEEGEITWQYAVVSRDFAIPSTITHEILDECYISEHDISTRSSDSGIDWDEVEREAYRLTGNADMLLPGTRAATASNPSGRITIVDPLVAEGKPFGVAGVRVSCNSFVKFAHSYTSRDGFYEMETKFSSKLRYRLVFTNSKNFSIGLNLILIPASISTLGSGPAEGLNVNVTNTSDERLYRRCVVNNAVYDYISRCSESDMNISLPPRDLRLWIFKNLSSSCTPMIHHGALIDKSLIGKYLGGYAELLRKFLPDIIIGTDKSLDYSEIYSVTVHELSHASHFSQAGTAWWDNLIEYIISSFIASGKTGYGDGTASGAGHCEVAEMWGYFNESKMYKERYGGTVPSFGTSYWFYPQIFRYLDDRGLTRAEIFRALKSDVTSRKELQAKLVSLYPERRGVIDQVFNRYE